MIKKFDILKSVINSDLKLLETNPEKFWEGVTDIAGLAFNTCDKEFKVDMPETVTYLDSSAFERCGVTYVNMSNSIKRIPYNTFKDCRNLKQIKLSKKLERIDGMSFQNSGLLLITLPASVRVIGFDAFMNCKNLKLVELSKNLQTIADYAFAGCKNLERVNIPECVVNFGENVFEDCDSLQAVQFEIGGEKKTLKIVDHNSITANEIITMIVNDRANFDLYKTYYEKQAPLKVIKAKVKEFNAKNANEENELSL